MPAARVHLVRHAEAERLAGDDASRRLTPGGRARFADLLRALGPRLRVTRVLTSPLLRARETAGLLAAASGAKLEEAEALAAGASSARELLELAARAGPGAALVGHNPEIAEAVSLAAGRAVEVRPGTVAALDLDGGRATLAWLEAP